MTDRVSADRLDDVLVAMIRGNREQIRLAEECSDEASRRFCRTLLGEDSIRRALAVTDESTARTYIGSSAMRWDREELMQ